MLIQDTLCYGRDSNGESGWLWKTVRHNDAVNVCMPDEWFGLRVLAHDLLEHPNMDQIDHDMYGVMEEVRAFGAIIFQGRANVRMDLVEYRDRWNECLSYETEPDADPPAALDASEQDAVDECLPDGFPLVLLSALYTGYAWARDTYGSSGGMAMLFHDIQYKLDEKLKTSAIDWEFEGEIIDVTVDTETREIKLEWGYDYDQIIEELLEDE